MRKTALLMIMVLALAMGAMAPAFAQGGPSPERGNSLSGKADPVDLEADDISFETIGDIDYVVVDHEIASEHDGYDTLVQREPARYQQNDVDEDPEEHDTAWLGIAGPDGDEIEHQGKLDWYYEVADGEWVSLTFQFDGDGELVRVNDVRP